MSTNPLLKGTLQTIILKLLEDNAEMYGYEITQKVKEISAGRCTADRRRFIPGACISWKPMAF
jgi:DNA-binding PadR family transcriptional regulator